MRLLVVLGAVLALAPAAFAGPGLRVGAVDDAAVRNDPAAQMDLAKLAGFDSIRMTAQWSPGATIMPPGQLSRLQRAALFASMRGLVPIVSIYNPGGSSAPIDPAPRAQFVELVGNEPNSSVYWQPQFDAAGGDAAAKAYEQLLAATYDGIKAARSSATVIGGALDPRGGDDPAGARLSHSPTTFIRDLGLAWVFHVVDESALGAWQSGPFYADGTPKSSLGAIHDAAVAARTGNAASCPDRTPPKVAVSTANGAVSAAAFDNVGVGKVSLFVDGRASGVAYAVPYAFTWAPTRAGRYTLEVRAADASGNVGRTRVTVAAAHARRGAAATPSGWIFTRVRPRRGR